MGFQLASSWQIREQAVTQYSCWEHNAKWCIFFRHHIHTKTNSQPGLKEWDHPGARIEYSRVLNQQVYEFEPLRKFILYSCFYYVRFLILIKVITWLNCNKELGRWKIKPVKIINNTDYRTIFRGNMVTEEICHIEEKKRLVTAVEQLKKGVWTKWENIKVLL